jgi:hypothetical protein
MTTTAADDLAPRKEQHVTDATTTDAAEAVPEQAPEVLAELAASAAELAEAAAEHAASAAAEAAGHRDRTYAYAARAEHAKQHADALTAADAATAAEAEAGRARLAVADAEAHVGFATRHHGVIAGADGEHDAELAAAAEAIDRAKAAWDAARQAHDAADAAARTAGRGVDWLRYHLDNRCRHWRDRITPPTDEELAAAASPPF